MTCGNWTKGGADGSAMVGHHDRAGPMTGLALGDLVELVASDTGCNMEKLRSTGGDGLFYCFAVK